jgi:hypothetical protein
MKRLIVIILISLSCSCAKTVYLPVENIRTEYKTKLEKDSIYLRDSIFVRQTDDTVFVVKYKYLYKTQIRVDTIIKVDSINVPYEVVRTVTKTQKGFFFYFGIFAILSCLIYIKIKISKFFK